MKRRQASKLYNREPWRLVVDLLIDHVLGLLLLVVDDVANPDNKFTGGDKGGSDKGLAVCNNVLTADLLLLLAERLQNVVLGFETSANGQGNDALGTGVQLLGGLLDDGEALVNLGQGLVAEVVCLFGIGAQVSPRTSEVREKRLGKGLVGRVAVDQGLLADGVVPEGNDTVVYYRVIQEVLSRTVSKRLR